MKAAKEGFRGFARARNGQRDAGQGGRVGESLE
jgi:hypothetical protein